MELVGAHGERPLLLRLPTSLPPTRPSPSPSPSCSRRARNGGASEGRVGGLLVLRFRLRIRPVALKIGRQSPNHDAAVPLGSPAQQRRRHLLPCSASGVLLPLGLPLADRLVPAVHCAAAATSPGTKDLYLYAPPASAARRLPTLLYCLAAVGSPMDPSLATAGSGDLRSICDLRASQTLHRTGCNCLSHLLTP
jgi:hypothetical protein